MDKLSLNFNQREIERINKYMRGTLKISFPPKKKSDYIRCIFRQIHRNSFDNAIKYFRDLNGKSIKSPYLINLAGLCKSIVTVPGIWRFYYSKCDDSHILHLPIYVKKLTQNIYQDLSGEYTDKLDEEYPIDIEYRKLSLFAFEFHDFWPLIGKIKKYYPEGLFHHFTFEESLFFLYLFPDLPIFIWSKKKYHKNIEFYVNCIAAAIQSFMEGLGYKHAQKYCTENDNSSLSQLIFLDFLDFYENNLKINENTCKYYI